MELNRSELLKFLSVLEGELQAREVVIAVLKSELVKRLLYPSQRRRNDQRLCDSQHSAPTTGTATMIPNKASKRCAAAAQLTCQQQQQSQQQHADNDKRDDNSSDPYSALMRDACAAFDPTFDELSTKSVFNTQLKQLDLLVEKHKKAIHLLKCKINEMNEKYNVVFEELQVERQKNIDFERDKVLRNLENLKTDKAKLEKEIETIKAQMDAEREREKKMIICLLAERKQLIIRLIEEKQKHSELIQMYNKDKKKISEMVEDLEEESKRSLQMELDLEKLTNEYEAQKETLKEKLLASEARNVSLSAEVERLRAELELKCKGGPILKDIGEGVRSAIVTMNSTITGHRVSPSVSSVATVNPPKVNVARPVSPSRSVSNTAAPPIAPSSPAPIKAVPVKTINPTSVHTSAIYATVQPSSKQPLTQLIASSESTTSPLPLPSKAAVAKVITSNPSSTASSFQNLTYSIESAIPPMPSTHPPAIPPLAKAPQIVAGKAVSGNQQQAGPKKITAPLSMGANSTTTTAAAATRGAPPPVPPNKPVLPPQALKERSKELQAGVARAKLGSSISGPVSGVMSKLITVTQPVVVAGVSGPDSKTGEILNLSPKKINEAMHNGSKIEEVSTDSLLSANNNVDMLCQELADFQQLLVSMVTSKNN
ncbi:hypothetical protein B4U79_05350 [Dinothrombium tinctorium]|uniref:Cortactin-binding protein-2 N-terminal domain-containing protein n=1 Tax=Dinothrombium tinctorium TaxID=1965070 RepID=A0A3S3QLF7_9ACAR|nr:hypothetical protein B4U79_05350 [Dinothrombium tinctorium]